jgi:hypothetical protein
MAWFMFWVIASPDSFGVMFEGKYYDTSDHAATTLVQMIERGGYAYWRADFFGVEIGFKSSELNFWENSFVGFWAFIGFVAVGKFVERNVTIIDPPNCPQCKTARKQPTPICGRCGFDYTVGGAK